MNEERNLELGFKVKTYRELRGLTQVQLAEMVSKAPSWVSALEIGTYKSLPPESFNALHQALGFPGWEILEAMGYETDGGYLGVEALLVQKATALTREQQLKLVAIADEWEPQFRIERRTEASGPLQPPPRGRPRKHRTLTRPITQG